MTYHRQALHYPSRVTARIERKIHDSIVIVVKAISTLRLIGWVILSRCARTAATWIIQIDESIAIVVTSVGALRLRHKLHFAGLAEAIWRTAPSVGRKIDISIIIVVYSVAAREQLGVVALIVILRTRTPIILGVDISISIIVLAIFTLALLGIRFVIILKISAARVLAEVNEPIAIVVDIVVAGCSEWVNFRWVGQ